MRRVPRMDLAYEVGGLRAGASGLQGVARGSDAAGAALRAAAVEAVMFGQTPGAAAFAATVAAAQAAQARGFRQEAQRAGDLGARSDTTAGLGDALTAQTAAVARTGAR